MEERDLQGKNMDSRDLVSHSECKFVLLHDFLADVKDWLFHNLLQLNLDKTGIIQGEEKLE